MVVSEGYLLSRVLVIAQGRGAAAVREAAPRLEGADDGLAAHGRDSRQQFVLSQRVQDFSAPSTSPPAAPLFARIPAVVNTAAVVKIMLLL